MLPNDALKTGSLSKQLVQTLFRGRDGSGTVSVRFWPLVTARKASHAASRVDGMPEIVAPVVTEGFVDRAGRIVPTRNAIARDLLTPLPRGVFALGSVEALDDFLTTTPLPEVTTADGWQDYRQHCRQMVDALAPGRPSDEKEYLPTGSGFIEVSESADATVRGMLDLYDNLLANEPDTPLLCQIALPHRPEIAMDHGIEKDFSRRLAHSNPHFPLAEQQRQVLTWLSGCKGRRRRRVVAQLRDRLSEDANKLRQLDKALGRRRTCAAALLSELGEDPGAEQTRRADTLRASQKEADRLAAARAALDHYFASKSWLTGLFGFIFFGQAQARFEGWTGCRT